MKTYKNKMLVRLVSLFYMFFVITLCFLFQYEYIVREMTIFIIILVIGILIVMLFWAFMLLSDAYKKIEIFDKYLVCKTPFTKHRIKWEEIKTINKGKTNVLINFEQGDLLKVYNLKNEFIFDIPVEINNFDGLLQIILARAIIAENNFKK